MVKGGGVDIDSLMEEQADMERRDARMAAQEQGGSASDWQGQQAGKALVGSVEQFYDKICVAAVRLTDQLKIGDVIEIGNDEEAIRQRVSSMQIDGQGVESATAGDSIGIKLNHPVKEGEGVWKMQK